MSTVERIEKEISELSPEEFAEIRDWILEQDWKSWDEQIEADVANGKLDRLFSESVADHDAGKSTEL